MARPHIRVEGLRELTRDIRKVDRDLGKALRQANKRVAEVVVTKALPHVPVRSGRLRRSVRALASQRKAEAKAGGARVPYAAAIHWGRKRGGFIEGRPFLWEAAQRVTAEGKAAREYEAEIDELLDIVRGRRA